MPSHVLLELSVRSLTWYFKYEEYLSWIAISTRYRLAYFTIDCCNVMTWDSALIRDWNVIGNCIFLGKAPFWRCEHGIFSCVLYELWMFDTPATHKHIAVCFLVVILIDFWLYLVLLPRETFVVWDQNFLIFWEHYCCLFCISDE